MDFRYSPEVAPVMTLYALQVPNDARGLCRHFPIVLLALDPLRSDDYCRPSLLPVLSMTADFDLSIFGDLVAICCLFCHVPLISDFLKCQITN